MKLHVFLLCVLTFVINHSDAARRFNVAQVAAQLKSKTGFQATRKQLAYLLNLRGNENIEMMRSMRTVQGRTKERLRQTYGGLEVVGGSISADVNQANKYTGTVSGELFTDLRSDIPKPSACRQGYLKVLSVVSNSEKVPINQMFNVIVERKIFVKKDGKAVLAYEVNFFYRKGSTPSRPCYFVDACSLKVIYNFNNIQSKALGKKQVPCETQTSPVTTQEPSTSPTTPAPTSPAATTQAPTTPAPATQAQTTLAPPTAEACFTDATTSVPPPEVTPSLLCSVAQGKGGNQKVGQWFYGATPYCLNATISGSTCILENDYAKVIDLKQGTTQNNGPAARYTCSQGYKDAVNGAYSPVLDALYFGTNSARMFIEWYNMTALNFKPVLYVHYGSNYENAFWDGSSLTFGDGQSTFYPLVNQDVVAHELAHGVTSQYSDLIYDDQSGGINEAFSDITGETTEMFARRSNDWLVGSEIFKSTNGALRYFDDPTRDGSSLKHVRDYDNSVDVHYSSGIFNHAFYQIVQVNSMPIKDAYECFLRANLLYWSRSTTFEQGACDVVRACYDLGFDFNMVQKSFEIVGISFATCNSASFIETLSASETLPDLEVSSSRRPVFMLSPPASTSTLRVTTSDTAVPVNVEVLNGLESSSAQTLSSGSDYKFKPGQGTTYLRLSSPSKDVITGVSLQITFQ